MTDQISTPSTRLTCDLAPGQEVFITRSTKPFIIKSNILSVQINRTTNGDETLVTIPGLKRTRTYNADSIFLTKQAALNSLVIEVG